MKKMIGIGIFTWGGFERRSDRYGAIALVDKTYQDVTVTTTVNNNALQQLNGKRVRLWAKVLEARESGHLGDLAHHISPSQPDVGEEIILGVGILRVLPREWACAQMALEPGDGRSTFWIDPRKLYRLHDQTVEIHAEETQDDFSPAPEIRPAEAETIATGESDFSVQVKGAMPSRILPEIESLGEGMFIFSMPEFKAGRRLKTS